MKAFNKYFLDVFKNHYFNFNGRATRTQYWMFILFIFVINALMSLLTIIICFLGINGNIVAVLSSIISLVFIIPSICIATRRLHDVNRSGWFQLLPTLGLFVLISTLFLISTTMLFTGVIIWLTSNLFLLYLLISPSDEGENSYGLPSKG